VAVEICTPEHDVLLTTAGGRCIRFLLQDEVRLFKGRDSDGVRAIKLDEGDTVISMTILTHVDAEASERAQYLKQANMLRRAQGEEIAEDAVDEGDEEETIEAAGELTPERFAELGAKEQYVLTVSERGFGKRTSSYEYRTSGRGGKGIVAMVVNDRNGPLVASFPVADSDQIMLVTDGGQLIRCPVNDVRIAGRNTQGVRVFKTDAEERVVSVEHIPDDGSEGVDSDEGGGEDGEGSTPGEPG
jgi:DNA gyrase subunit A